MSTALVPDTRTDRHAIARGLVEVDHLDHEAALWRELADFLAEPLALHNLLARARREILQGIFDQPEPENYCKWHDLFDCPYAHAPDEREDGSDPEPTPHVDQHTGEPFAPEPEPEPLPVLADVAPRRGGKYRRTEQPGWLQRLRKAVRKEWRDEIGAPA